MNFDKILTDSVQIFIIDVKNHQIHIEQIRNVIFSKYKIQRQKSSRIWMLKQMLTLIDFGPKKQNPVICISTISIY